MRPMLASTAEHVPSGSAWAHEIKWDGMRVLADVRDGRLTLWSRTERDVTASYPELAPLADLYDDMLLDGEVVALRDGRPSFSALQDRMQVSSAARAAQLVARVPVTYVTFDVLRLLGEDLVGHPWTVRRQLLEQLDLDGDRWQTPPVYDDGAELLGATADQGLEGIVSKRRSSTYSPGRRSPDWVKTAHRGTTSTVIGGWRPETGSSDRLGAVLLGIPGDGGLRFVGRMGSGLGGKAGVRLRDLLADYATDTSPFADEVPRVDAAGARWVRPEVVVDVRSLGRTEGGRLRQPSYHGVRADLTPEDLDG